MLEFMLFWIVLLVICFRLYCLDWRSGVAVTLLILCESIVVDCQGIDEGVYCFVEICWHDIIVVSVFVPLDCGGNTVLC